MAGTTKWGLYQVDTSANNYFGGKVGIGQVAPTFPLDLLVTTSSGVRVMCNAAIGAGSGGSVALYANNIPTAADQRLGRFVFGMLDAPTGNGAETAIVAAFSEEAWAYNTARGTYLRFETLAPGSVSRLEKMRLTGAGNLCLGATTFGTNAVKVMVIGSGTAPSTSPADAVQLWSADRGATAGKAGLHIMSEDGTSHVFSDRVGIGTITPESNVEIYHAAAPYIQITDSTTPTKMGMGSVDASVWLGSITNHFLVIRTNNTEQVRIDTSGNLGLCQASFGTNAAKVLAIGNGTAPASSPTDAAQLYSADQAAGNACLHTRTENGAVVKLFQGAALTAQLTTLTYTAPGTPDYAIQDLIQPAGYGFVTKDEGNTVLKVIANLQTRVSELETRLKAHGLLA